MRFRHKNGLASGYSSRGGGELILFLHPVGTDKSLWEPVIDALQDRYRLVAVDFRGHGDSDTPSAAFTLADLAGDVAELLSVLRGGKPAVVVGCSLGGMVAQELALLGTGLVRGIVLANTVHTLPDQGRSMMRERAETARSGMPALVEITIDRWFSEPFRQADPAAVDRIRQQLLHDDPIVHAWAWDAIAELHTAPRLGKLDMPALVVTGECDVSTPPAITEAIAAAIRGSRYRIAPGAGHMLPIEQPKLLAGWIDEFVAGLNDREHQSQRKVR